MVVRVSRAIGSVGPVGDVVHILREHRPLPIPHAGTRDEKPLVAIAGHSGAKFYIVAKFIFAVLIQTNPPYLNPHIP